MTKGIAFGLLLMIGLCACFLLHKGMARGEMPRVESRPVGIEKLLPDAEEQPFQAARRPYLDEKVPNKETEHARDRKVTDLLQRFIKKTAEVTKESVAAEREKIAQGLRLAVQRERMIPKIRDDYDTDGNTWEVLDYGEGIIRYLPPSE